MADLGSNADWVPAVGTSEGHFTFQCLCFLICKTGRIVLSTHPLLLPFLLTLGFSGISAKLVFILLLQEGEPLPGAKTGLLSNPQKGIVRGDTRADKARGFIGKGQVGGEREDKGPQEDCSATWLTVSGFTVM